MKVYNGKVLQIDLTSKNSMIEKVSEDIMKTFLGGKGLGVYLLYNYLKPKIEPYDPSNPLIFVTGPLTGTIFPCVSRTGVVTKSPMTNTFLDSYAGGVLGHAIKAAGYDALIFTGKSSKPIFVSIEEDKVSFEDASYLWGVSSLKTENIIRNQFRNESKGRIGTAVIGPAGEKMVRFSGIITENRIFGRGGAGAVMGSKNLKGLIMRGNRDIEIYDESKFKEIVKRCHEKIGSHPMTKRGGLFPRVGTMHTVNVTNETGTLPTRYWRENSYDHAVNINGESFIPYILRSRGCFLCPIACSRDTKGIWSGKEYITEGPEYETIYAFGSNLEVNDPNLIIAADQLCDEYGMDTISCGNVIGFAMECFERGLIKREDIGFDLSFGNGDSILSMIQLIGERQGIGNILAEGVMRASMKIEGSSGFAMHVKGLELPGYDPRGMKGQGLTYALSDRGACHLRSNTLRTELLGLPKPIDRYAYDGKPEMVFDLQLNYVMFDCLISCVFAGLAITTEDYLNTINAITGWSINYDEFRKIHKRVWTFSRLFNCREGFRRKDDTLPFRLFANPLQKGQVRGRS